jgi:hypothetical protein
MVVFAKPQDLALPNSSVGSRTGAAARTSSRSRAGAESALDGFFAMIATIGKFFAWNGPRRVAGLAEGFVNTFNRDYVNAHELCDTENVLAQFRSTTTTTWRRTWRSACGAWPTTRRLRQRAVNSCRASRTVYEWRTRRGPESAFTNLIEKCLIADL